ncbi:MAG: hypothetical protein V3R67_04390, partial [Thermodesulfobacteriota bacterium]
MKFHSEGPSKPSGTSSIVSRLLSAQKGSSMVLLWALLVGSLTGFVGALFQIALAQVATLKNMFMNYLEVTPGLPL